LIFADKHYAIQAYLAQQKIIMQHIGVAYQNSVKITVSDFWL